MTRQPKNTAQPVAILAGTSDEHLDGIRVAAWDAKHPRLRDAEATR